MTLLYAANECAGVLPLDAGVYEQASTDTNYVDPNFVRAAIVYAGGGARGATKNVGALSEGYIRWQERFVNSGGAQTSITVYSNAGIAVVRAQAIPSSTSYRVQYWDGSAWVSLTDVNFVAAGVRQTFDLYVKAGASGRIRLFVAGTPRLDTGTIDLSAVTDIAQAYHHGPSNGAAHRSQIIICSDPTIGLAASTLVLTANGANTDLTGDYTAVDEVTYNDADSITSATANQVSTFVASNPTDATSAIRGVVINVRAKKGTSGPTKIKACVRVGGTNYFSAAQDLDVGYKSFTFVFETNPATGVAWLPSEVNAAEYGVQSIA